MTSRITYVQPQLDDRGAIACTSSTAIELFAPAQGLELWALAVVKGVCQTG